MRDMFLESKISLCFFFKYVPLLLFSYSWSFNCLRKQLDSSSLFGCVSLTIRSQKRRPPSLSLLVVSSWKTRPVPDRIGIWKCWFLSREEKPEDLEKKKPGARRRTNNKLNPHMTPRESNPGHIGGRRVLSPLCHPCSPIRV